MSYIRLGAVDTGNLGGSGTAGQSAGQARPKKKKKKKQPPKKSGGGFWSQVAKKVPGKRLGQQVGRRPPGRAVGWDKAKLKSVSTVATTPGKRRPPTILTYPAPGTSSSASPTTAEPTAPTTGGGGGGGSVWSDDATAAPDELELDEETGDAVTAPTEKKGMSTTTKVAIVVVAIGGVWYWNKSKKRG